MEPRRQRKGEAKFIPTGNPLPLKYSSAKGKQIWGEMVRGWQDGADKHREKGQGDEERDIHPREWSSKSPAEREPQMGKGSPYLYVSEGGWTPEQVPGPRLTAAFTHDSTLGSLSSRQFRNVQAFQEKQQINDEGGLPETQEAKINSPTSNGCEEAVRNTDAFKEGRHERGRELEDERRRGAWKGFRTSRPRPAGGPRSPAVLAPRHPSELRTLTVGGRGMLTPLAKKRAQTAR